jgi:hypothetical protein
MQYKPEVERMNTKDLEDVKPGTHSMKVASYSPEVQTAKWSGAIVEFVTMNGDAKISEFIDQKTAWKFGRLAKALGDDAREKYHATDSSGFSLFNPAAFVGRVVTIEAEENISPSGAVRSRIARIDSAGDGDVGDPQNLDDGRHDSGSNDDSDIPF